MTDDELTRLAQILADRIGGELLGYPKEAARHALKMADAALEERDDSSEEDVA